MFQEQGFIGPFQALHREECSQLMSRLRAQSNARVWHKGNAPFSADYYRLATRPALMALLEAVLGEDILLWGACLIGKKPGEAHHWHTDIEGHEQSGLMVNIWIGLEGTNRGSAPRFISRSHRFGEILERVAFEHGTTTSEVTTGEVLKWAQSREPHSEVVHCDVRDGQALMFHSKLWHGSRNTNPFVRNAVLLQYATPDTKIRIPDPRRQYQWPFTFLPENPPCLMVRGIDRLGVNELVEPPQTSPRAKPMEHLKEKYPHWPSWAESIDNRQHDASVRGWQVRHLFEGSTPSMKQLSVHSVTLNPGARPHTLHDHPEEELMVILSGEIEVTREDKGDRGARTVRGVGPGSISYHPAQDRHTHRNTGRSPSTFLAFKWLGEKNALGDRAAPFFVFDPATDVDQYRTDSSKGSTFTALLSSSTRYLSRLHCHLDTFEPGTGYPKHADPYDIFLIVLGGTVQIFGQEFKENSVIFHPEGEEHSLTNVGPTTARVLVLEFHGAGHGMSIDENRIQDIECWNRQSDQAAAELALTIPAGRQIILVDDDSLGTDFFGNYDARPFLEHDGQYWGAPSFDEIGIQELERMRSSGATYLVFCWPAFWWLDFYADFHSYLRSKYKCLLATENVKVFRLD
jgi:quercetin dioxygenase-like cupin family protein